MSITEKILLVVELIGAVCALVPTLVSIFALIKNIIKNKNWALIMKIANSAMSTVEAYSKEHPGMTSEEKLEMALEVIKTSCQTAGIALDEANLQRIVEYIAEMCTWAKTVNVTNKSKTNTKKTAEEK
ncbi:phage holin, LLH family [Intestinibacter sp.]|uniref:phage holin, LLH family n=1 Tax=Intestinibacter sp. TaxID=1965304 RepID=UPI002A74CB6B|nr:phage holin, LLH family [Intestinibacter sp.]MDY2737671.1 phage holin, LLH family [Intestinibacter sp.]